MTDGCVQLPDTYTMPPESIEDKYDHIILPPYILASLHTVESDAHLLRDKVLTWPEPFSKPKDMLAASGRLVSLSGPLIRTC